MIFSLLSLCSLAYATKLLDRNLVYRSPFQDLPEVTFGHTMCASQNLVVLQFSRDTNAIHTRFIRHAKRQIGDATVFDDEHYPTFYGSDFSNVRANIKHSLLSFTTSIRVLSFGREA
jgi:alkaline phosphatase D